MLETAILLGAPGSGKGTAAEDLRQATQIVHISTGDMLREGMRQDPAIERAARPYIEKGALVPDEIIMQIVRARLDAGPRDARYLFDGFPRTLTQARLLDDLLAENGRGILRHVFLLDVPTEDLVNRIAGRRICRSCGAVYHIPNIPPKVEGRCDLCGGELYQRPDDNRETVLKRLEVYHHQTVSLVDYYTTKQVLRVIDARDRLETLQSILAVLKGGSVSHD